MVTTRLVIIPRLPPRTNMHLIVGIAPDQKTDWDFHVTPEKAKQVARVSMGAVKDLGVNVPMVLKDKNSMVFQGIRRDGHTEGLCYVGWPIRRFGTGGGDFLANQDDSFFVFVNEERIIYHSIWERVSAKNLEFSYLERFARRIR